MMALSKLDMEAFDKVQVELGYLKLFDLIIADFITRKDAKQMMSTSNLPFTSNVVVSAGQLVVTAGSPTAQSGSTTSPGQGAGRGNVTPLYDGTFLLPEDELLKEEKRLLKEAGGTVPQELLETAIGGV
jgi:hypothetical protein